MHRSTMILSIILALLIAGAIVFWTGGSLSTDIDVVTASAAEHPKALRSIEQVLGQSAAPQLLTDHVPDDLSACRLEDVTLRLHNPGFIDAEWLYAWVEAAKGDIAVYSVSGEGGTVPALGDAEYNLKLVTALGGPRVLHLEYYVYGVRREIRIDMP